MVSRRSLLWGLPLLLSPLSGCSGSSPTTICEVSATNWDRERHRIRIEITAADEVLWTQSATVPGRTDDVIPGPTWGRKLPDQRATYTVRAKVDDGEWSSTTLGDDGSSVDINAHANEDGDPEIWSATECASTTTEA